MSEPETREYRNPKDETRPTEELVRLAVPEEDEDEYWYLVSALQARGTREVFDTVRDFCTSESADERALCVDVLAQLGWTSPEERPFSEESVAILLAMLEHEEDTSVLSSIGSALGHLNDPRCIEPMSKFKMHPDRDVRDSVVMAMLTHEDPVAIETLIELSGDEDEDVRNWATFGLGRQVDSDSVEIRQALIARLNEENAEIRGEALVGLALRKDKRVIEPLINELQFIESAEEWCTLPIEAAEEIGDPRLCPYLIPLREKTWGVEEAIEACKPQSTGEPD